MQRAHQRQGPRVSSRQLSAGKHGPRTSHHATLFQKVSQHQQKTRPGRLDNPGGPHYRSPQRRYPGLLSDSDGAGERHLDAGYTHVACVRPLLLRHGDSVPDIDDADQGGAVSVLPQHIPGDCHSALAVGDCGIPRRLRTGLYPENRAAMHAGRVQLGKVQRRCFNYRPLRRYQCVGMGEWRDWRRGGYLAVCPAADTAQEAHTALEKEGRRGHHVLDRRHVSAYLVGSRILKTWLTNCVTRITIVSMLRLKSLVHFANSYNPTWDQWSVVFWSTIEVSVGFICTCLPALRLILMRMYPQTFKSDSYASSSFTSRNLYRRSSIPRIVDEGCENDLVDLSQSNLIPAHLQDTLKDNEDELGARSGKIRIQSLQALLLDENSMKGTARDQTAAR